jgi:hypothetical protein
VSERLGTLVVGGRAYPITSLALARGRLEMRGELPGPSEAIEASPVAVFGADGQGVCQGGSLTLPAASRDETAEVTVYLQVDAIRDGGPG